MSKKKPQWLIDAEKAMAEFNDSKYGKMSDIQIAQSVGGAYRATSFNTEFQKKAAASRKPETLSKAGKIGGYVTGKMRKINTKILKQRLYDLIDLEEFTVYDLEPLVKYFDEFQDLQMFRIYLRDKSKYEVVGIKPNGKPGANPKIYRKRAI